MKDIAWEGLKGEKAVVIGLGKSGRAAAGLLLKLGAEVWITESSTDHVLEERARAFEKAGARVELGAHSFPFLRGATLGVVSPGVDPSCPAVGWLEKEGVRLISEIELAFHCLQAPVVAVTGTNGKTTTVFLIEHILRGAGFRARRAGNVDVPFSELVLEKEALDVAVVEVSSFQLERIERFRPAVSVLLNVAEDHLDRYRSFSEYLQTKFRIFENQGRGDRTVLPLSLKDTAPLPEGVEGLFFSPAAGGGADVRPEGGAIRIRSGARAARPIPLSGWSLPGRHNLENLLAAVAAAWAFGVREEAVEAALATFRPLDHRLEEVATLGGVRFVNDSKATNPAALLSALSAVGEPVILIAGGRDKGFDFTRLREPVEGRLRLAVLLGEARERLAEALRPCSPLLEARSIEEAVAASWRRAQPGDCVLLSPACSSLDMFSDYAERGEAFRRAVRNLEKENEGGAL